MKYLLFFLFTTTALAAPPPLDSEQYKLMAPYSGAISRASRPGAGGSIYFCCSVADGRVVEERSAVDPKTGEGYYEVLFPKEDDKAFPTGWQRVPNEAVIHAQNEMGGQSIAWWVAGVVRCFQPGVKI